MKPTDTLTVGGSLLKRLTASRSRTLCTRRTPAANGQTKQIPKEAELGKGAKVTIFAGDKVIAKGALERTVPAQYGLGEGMDIGMDIGSPVDFTYELPFMFNGEIKQLVFDLE